MSSRLLRPVAEAWRDVRMGVVGARRALDAALASVEAGSLSPAELRFVLRALADTDPCPDASLPPQLASLLRLLEPRWPEGDEWSPLSLDAVVGHVGRTELGEARSLLGSRAQGPAWLVAVRAVERWLRGRPTKALVGLAHDVAALVTSDESDPGVVWVRRASVLRAVVEPLQRARQTVDPATRLENATGFVRWLLEVGALTLTDDADPNALAERTAPVFERLPHERLVPLEALLLEDPAVHDFYLSREALARALLAWG